MGCSFLYWFVFMYMVNNLNEEINRALILMGIKPIIESKTNKYDRLKRKQGYWVDYHENGNLRSKGNYKNNKENGVWEYYDDKGLLRSKGNYVNGNPIGVWEEYYENSKLYSRGKFINKYIEDGIWEYYHPNGKLWSKGNYKNGVMDGSWVWYDENGGIMSRVKYIKGIKQTIEDTETTQNNQPESDEGVNDKQTIKRKPMPVDQSIRKGFFTGK